jgi:hypothetical protein
MPARAVIPLTVARAMWRYFTVVMVLPPMALPNASSY